jgi:hypothetical protein
MLYYVTLNGINIVGFDSINLAKYKVIELYQTAGLKCDVYFDSYEYSKMSIKKVLPNIVDFNTILNQFKDDII